MSRAPSISRRQMVVAAAAVPLGTMSERVEALSWNDATFVLVHGAWHGGWCWSRVAPLLRGAGYPVFAPTLTGLGERLHLLTPQVDLDTHVRDITSLLDYEDLHNVILVGHSYGGMVISGVAETAGTRLAQLVYLDAFLPENGKALKDYSPIDLEGLARTRGDGWRVPPTGSARDFGVTDEKDIAWVDTRLGDQPLKTFTQPARLSGKTSSPPARAFIRFTKAPFFVEAATRARKQGFRSFELLSGGHDAMITRPTELTRMLTTLV